jgi:alanyl-tRNA synthetase
MHAISNGKITEVRFIEDQQFITIDHPDLYPGGGGQLPDKATITTSTGSFPIAETLLLDEKYFWKIASSTKLATEEIKVCIDPQWRLEMSQQHTAQHILSAFAKSFYSWESTGFAIFEENSKIEFLTETDLENACPKLESAVLECISNDLPISIYQSTNPQNLRKAQEHENLRIVEIEGLDRCGCGGTHVSKTSYIGAFSILKWERKNKASLRVTFAAGLRLGKLAKRYSDWEQDLRKKLTGDVDERIDDLLHQLQQNSKNEKKWIQLLAQHLPVTQNWTIIRDLPIRMDAIRLLANTIHQQGGRALLLSEDKQFIIAGPNSEQLMDLLRSHGAKGGGKNLINGTMDSALSQQLESLIETL